MNPVLTSELRACLARGDAATLREFAEDFHPAALAECLEGLSAGEVAAFLSFLEPRRGAEVFSYLPTPLQLEVAERFTRQDLARLLTYMSHDERADLVKRLEPETLEALWPALAQAEREDIRRLASYEEGTAGAVMTSDYVTLFPELTAAEALNKIRREAPDRETVYYAYVVSPDRRLLGAVTLKDLILARPSTLVRDILQPDPIRVRVTDDQEEVARTIEKYDLLAVPVVDAEDRMVGIVTHDDAFDILREEQTEDLERLMGITGEPRDEPYLEVPVWTHFRRRVGWVVGLAAVGIVSGLILHRYEDAIARLALLAVYIPMVADTGGNTGSQSATVVIRALALRQLSPRSALRVLWKEFRVSVLLGAVLGGLAYAKVLWLSHESPVPPGISLTAVAAAIALALGLQVVSATLVGAVLPLGAARLRLDPAVVASPAITTLVDITGLLIYFQVVRWVLGI
ncbi:magnesium transporter [Deferrisoma sp.]